MWRRCGAAKSADYSTSTRFPLDFLAFSGSKRKRRPPGLPDPAELLALAETDPEAALAALEAL
jgi:hypothetical protein